MLVENNNFDKVVTLLKENGIYQHSIVKNQSQFGLIFTDKWIPTKSYSKVNITGQIPKTEIFNKVNKAILESKQLEPQTYMTLRLQNGDKLPPFSNIINVFDLKPANDVHKQGRIQLILFWNNETKFSQWKILLDLFQKNKIWRDNIQIVAINTALSADAVKKYTSQHNITAPYIEFLIVQDKIEKDRIKLDFDLHTSSDVYIINRDGYIYNKIFWVWICFEDDSKIHQLLDGKEVDLDQWWKHRDHHPDYAVSEQDHIQMVKNLNQLANTSLGKQDFKIILPTFKLLKRGKQTLHYGPVKVRFFVQPEEAELRKQILDIIYKDVSQNAVNNLSFVKGEAEQYDEHRQKLTKITSSFNLPSPYIEERTKIDGFTGDKKVTKSLNFHPIVPVKDISIKNLLQLQKKVDTYFDFDEYRERFPFSLLYNKNLLKLEGEKFFEFTNLCDPKTGESIKLNTKEGRIEVIVFCYHLKEKLKQPTQPQAEILKLIQVVKTLKIPVYINIIYMEENIPTILQQIAKNNDPNMLTVYANGIKSPEVEALKIYNEDRNYLLIVDKNSTICLAQAIDMFNLPSIIEKVDLNEVSKLQFKEDSIVLFNKILEGQTFKVLKQQIKAFAYTPIFQIVQKINLDTKQILSIEVSIIINRDHEEVFKKLVYQMKKVANVSLRCYENFVIPKGEKCYECKSNLVLPYYFYYFQSNFRCLNCAPEKASRANGTLIFKDNSVVDIKRFGINLPFKQLSWQLIYPYQCMGCGSYQPDGARFVCMECLREPSGKSLLDLCQICAETLAGKENKKQNKETILSKCQVVKHTKEHALMRINSTYEYFDY